MALLDDKAWMITTNTRKTLDGASGLGVVYAVPALTVEQAWHNAVRATGLTKAAMRARGWRAVRVRIESLPRDVNDTHH
jgi:hypothetical protein